MLLWPRKVMQARGSFHSGGCVASCEEHESDVFLPNAWSSRGHLRRSTTGKCVDCRPFMNAGMKLYALLKALATGIQLWISNRGLFGKESSFLVRCHDFRLGASVRSCLTSVKLLNSVPTKMILARLTSKATATGSFRSCRCSMKFLRQDRQGSATKLTLQ